MRYISATPIMLAVVVTSCCKRPVSQEETIQETPRVVVEYVTSLGWDWSYAVPEVMGIIKCMAFSGLCIALTWLLTRMCVRLKI